MPIACGAQMPDVKLTIVENGEVREAAAPAFFAGRTIALFAVPGAFTGTCSTKHLPSFLNHADEFKAKGAEIVCLSVNDKDVMKAWGKATNAEGKITFIADGSGIFTKALGLEGDYSQFGMGMRSRRFSMLIKDGVLKELNLEEPGKFEKSSGEVLLQAL